MVVSCSVESKHDVAEEHFQIVPRLFVAVFRQQCGTARREILWLVCEC